NISRDSKGEEHIRRHQPVPRDPHSCELNNSLNRQYALEYLASENKSPNGPNCHEEAYSLVG
ncbi:11560_t:CDS:2, partial [Scutellospora calospora]